MPCILHGADQFTFLVRRHPAKDSVFFRRGGYLLVGAQRGGINIMFCPLHTGLAGHLADSKRVVPGNDPDRHPCWAK